MSSLLPETGSFPEPRPFQARAHDQLREGVRLGHKNQVLCAATGAGKTYLGLRIASEANKKGKRAAFVCDRNTLIDQTSETADRYGLSDHGVIQADHWRSNPSALLQIISTQTIAQRKWPHFDVLIIDECHTRHKGWVEHLVRFDGAVVGLSATPFAKGMGKLFSRVVNAATMKELTESGVLVPMRVMSAVRPDMAGAATSGGEWTDAAAAERGMEIVGDVVSEWLKHGEDRKTIVFGATIAHCEEICRQFNEAGVLAAVFSSRTPDIERKRLLDEYRKPDSALRVLVSVEALAKGFDVPDVGCVVDCRPLRKSLSTAIQMWGRGLRSSPSTGKTDCILLDHCIASGQRVLTHRGLVCIEEILISDKIWDGHAFVSHNGAISRGIRPVITYAGITATPDHPVKTTFGWRTLGQCAREQASIVTTGVGRTTLRECDGYFTGRSVAWAAGTQVHACSLRVRHLWVQVRDFVVELAERSNKRMSILQSATAIPEVAVFQGTCDEAALFESQGSTIQGLRRSWDRVPFRLCDHLRSLDQRELGPSPFSGVGGDRQDQQRWALRGGEHSLGLAAGQHEQHAAQQVGAFDAQISDGAPRRSLRRCIASWIHGRWNELCGNSRKVGAAIPQTEGQVWDILDCGPRNSFTCEGLLVHNSGNILRFKDDFEAIYFDGVQELDDGKKLDREIRKEPGEKEAKGCPKCGYKPFTSRCMACGFEIVQQSMIEAVPGQMKEVVLGSGKHKAVYDKRDLYRELCSYGEGRYEKAKGWAWHKFKDIAGHYPPSTWPYEPGVRMPSLAVMSKIKSLNIAWAKGKAA